MVCPIQGEYTAALANNWVSEFFETLNLELYNCDTHKEVTCLKHESDIRLQRES